MAHQFALEGFLPYRINSLAEKVSASLASVYASRFDVSVAQWRILATLDAYPGTSAKFIATQANLDKVKVSRAVLDLENRALLCRKPNVRDARSASLSLTPAGKRLFRQIAPLALAWEADFLRGLNHRERQQLFGLLAKLESAIAATPEGTARAKVAEV